MPTDDSLHLDWVSDEILEGALLEPRLVVALCVGSTVPT